MPDESVQCCVTSPPYWGLRDYGVDGQLGLESTPEEFVASMVEVFTEVRRVLRADGTCWLNLGDSYNTRQRGSDKGWDKSRLSNPNRVQKAQRASLRPRRQLDSCKPKDLIGIPWMVAFALRADGWYLRRDIIWAKANPMPESVQDRPTSSHEYLFLLTKSARYFYDAEAIREPATFAGPNGAQHSPHSQGFGRRTREEEKERQEQQSLGRNKRSVWDIPEEAWGQFLKWLGEQPQEKLDVWRIATRPYPEAHFATFPPDLVEPCILAGTPTKACGECGAPWERQVEVHRGGPSTRSERSAAGGRESGHRLSGGLGQTPTGKTGGSDTRGMPSSSIHTRGWKPTCEHDDDSGHAVVLDPFAGAATTGLVAARQNRDFIGIELNPEYVELGRTRIRDDAPLINTPAEVEPVSISRGALTR